MIGVVHPGSRNPDPDCVFIPDPGSRGQKVTGSRIRIRKTVWKKDWVGNFEGQQLKRCDRSGMLLVLEKNFLTSLMMSTWTIT